MGLGIFGKKKRKQKAAPAVSRSGKKMYKKKLVRDKIPHIIKKNGGRPVVRTAGKHEFTEALKRKILDESRELARAKTEGQELEEIIDIMEAINAYMKHKEISVEQAERMRKYKLRKRGGFEKAIILEGVE